MKNNKIILCCLFLLILVSGCSSKVSPNSQESSADWAFPFVVWNEDIYQIQNEEVNKSEIEDEIGEVKQYSDFEGIYSNGFSNKYLVGTKLYKIKGIDTAENIAIESEQGQYINAKNNGKYKGK